MHMPCKSTITRFDTNTATQWSILRHYGTHNHPWPEAKKPNKLAKEKLKTVVSKNPKEGAFSLKVSLTWHTDTIHQFQELNTSFFKIGKSSVPKDPFESVLQIHPSLANAERLAYHWRRILDALGIVPGKKALPQMKSFSQTCSNGSSELFRFFL